MHKRAVSTTLLHTRRRPPQVMLDNNLTVANFFETGGFQVGQKLNITCQPGFWHRPWGAWNGGNDFA